MTCFLCFACGVASTLFVLWTLLDKALASDHFMVGFLKAIRKHNPGVFYLACKDEDSNV